MTLTLKNNEPLDLKLIRNVEVRKVLDFDQRGRLYVKGWHVKAITTRNEILVAEYGRDQEQYAKAMCRLIAALCSMTAN